MHTNLSCTCVEQHCACASAWAMQLWPCTLLCVWRSQVTKKGGKGSQIFIAYVIDFWKAVKMVNKYSHSNAIMSSLNLTFADQFAKSCQQCKETICRSSSWYVWLMINWCQTNEQKFLEKQQLWRFWLCGIISSIFLQRQSFHDDYQSIFIIQLP